MRVSTDDDIYRVDQTWLGPKGVPMMGIRATYTQYAIWIVSFVLLLLVARRLVTIDVMALLWIAFAAVVVTKLSGKILDHDRPLSGMLAAAINEIDQPRHKRKAATTWRTRRIYVTTTKED